jgi:hypothetical protein
MKLTTAMHHQLCRTSAPTIGDRCLCTCTCPFATYAPYHPTVVNPQLLRRRLYEGGLRPSRTTHTHTRHSHCGRSQGNLSSHCGHPLGNWSSHCGHSLSTRTHAPPRAPVQHRRTHTHTHKSLRPFAWQLVESLRPFAGQLVESLRPFAEHHKHLHTHTHTGTITITAWPSSTST